MTSQACKIQTQDCHHNPVIVSAESETESELLTAESANHLAQMQSSLPQAHMPPTPFMLSHSHMKNQPDPEPLHAIRMRDAPSMQLDTVPCKHHLQVQHPLVCSTPSVTAHISTSHAPHLSYKYCIVLLQHTDYANTNTRAPHSSHSIQGRESLKGCAHDNNKSLSGDLLRCSSTRYITPGQ